MLYRQSDPTMMSVSRTIRHLTLILVLFAGSARLSAQDDGPRWYWMAPENTHLVNLFTWYTEGNSQPFRDSDFDPKLEIDSFLAVLGYNYYFGAFGRSASATLWAPFGYSEANLTGVGNQRSSGLGDIYWQGTINLLGVPAMNAEEFAGHVPCTIINLALGGELPTGSYDSNKSINMGQNRTSFRLSAPIVQPLGEWTPGKFTTFELMPAVWFYTDNNDSQGQTLSQDPLFSIEAHLTRDLTKRFWVSLDYQYLYGGETELSGVNQSDKQSASFLGATLACNLTETSSLTLRYQGGLADPDEDIQFDIFRLEYNILF